MQPQPTVHWQHLRRPLYKSCAQDDILISGARLSARFRLSCRRGGVSFFEYSSCPFGWEHQGLVFKYRLLSSFPCTPCLRPISLFSVLLFFQPAKGIFLLYVRRIRCGTSRLPRLYLSAIGWWKPCFRTHISYAPCLCLCTAPQVRAVNKSFPWNCVSVKVPLQTDWAACRIHGFLSGCVWVPLPIVRLLSVVSCLLLRLWHDSSDGYGNVGPVKSF